MAEPSKEVLGAVSGFDKSKLKKADTNEKTHLPSKADLAAAKADPEQKVAK